MSGALTRRIMLLNLRNLRTSRRVPHPRSLLRSALSPDSTLVHTMRPRPTLAVEHLFALSRDALVVIETASDRILRWNAAAEQLFGYAASEAIGRSARMLMAPPLARVHRERMAHYRRSGEADVFTDRPLSVPVVHRSGAELRVELSATPLDPPGGLRGLVLLMFRDASCQRRAEQSSVATASVEDSHHELEAQLREFERLLAATTRDIAEPVARVRRGAARLARAARNPDSGEPQRLALLAHVIEARTREVEQTLERITTLAAIQSGNFALHAERVNLVPRVTRLVADCGVLAPAHRLKLGAPQGLTAVCDAARIQSVLADLIERAERRNPRGCWIDVDLRRPLIGVAQIEVRDYGRRLTPRERERLATDRGWLIDQHILAQHGGSLTAEFPTEGGMRVALSLPTHRGRLAAR
jgi:two-component system, LuxR family, sensor kinase FixL